MKGQRPPTGQNVRGQLLGMQVTTKAAMPTSAQAIGIAVGDIMRPLQEGKRGKQFVTPALLDAWPEIVGERLASLCLPINMKAQPKSRSRHKKASDDGAVLEVRADPSITIDLDYGQALIVERINAILGYAAVARLKVLPKDMPDKPTTIQRVAQKTPSLDDRDKAAKLTASVESDGLRQALQDLGAAVEAAQGNKAKTR